MLLWECVFVGELFSLEKGTLEYFILYWNSLLTAACIHWNGALCVAITCFKTGFYVSHADLNPNDALECWFSCI